MSERNKAIARSEFEVWSTGELDRMRIEIEDQVAEGDKVVTRWVATMTHEGRLGDAEPSGNRVALSGTTIERFEDGKVVESWRSMDTLGLLRQIGALG
ncbi:MAG TPA: ester cyclase [Solirubrobacterales bacterium]|jgi:predicted ester cyclase|nr:ester cyclase [Solirubrobacterales bacterium]